MNSFRTEFTNGSEPRTLEETSRSHDTTITASGKFMAQILEEHSLVSGSSRGDAAPTRDDLQNGQPILTDFADNIGASTMRLAGYAQDEWTSPSTGRARGSSLGGHPTRGSGEEGQPERQPEQRLDAAAPRGVEARPEGRDQVRISLTRSYRRRRST